MYLSFSFISVAPSLGGLALNGCELTIPCVRACVTGIVNDLPIPTSPIRDAVSAVAAEVTVFQRVHTALYAPISRDHAREQDT